MKKMFFTAAATLVVLSACRNDDAEPVSQPVHPIVGTWKLNKTTIFSGTNNTVLFSETTPACEANSTFQFGSDKKFLLKTYSSATGSCALDGTESGTYSYAESTKTLTFTFPDNTTETSVLQSLTNNEMQIIADEDDYNSDGTIDKMIVFMNKQ